MGQNKYASLHPKLILLSLRHELCPVTAGTKHVKQATRSCGLSYSACPGTELLQWLQGTFLLNLRILEEEVDSHNRKGTLPQVTDKGAPTYPPSREGGLALQTARGGAGKASDSLGLCAGLSLLLLGPSGWST